MAPILEVASRHKIPVIGDGAQAHGASYKGQPISRFGLGTCFSFFPGKNLGALGDAGAIATNDANFAQELRSLRDHGRRGKKYEHDAFAWNMRLDGLQAAFLSAKLPYLEGWTRDRAAVNAFYAPRLATLKGIRVIEQSPSAGSAHHLFVICHEDREMLKKVLEKHGVGTGVHYPHGVHRQAAWHTKFAAVSLPHTEDVADHCLSLPIFGAMRENEAELVVEKLALALEECRGVRFG
jgi:dTDP-4-amino-4,6-dideoxygalactose transaminase